MNYEVRLVSKYRPDNNYLDQTLRNMQGISCKIYTSDFQTDTPYGDMINGIPVEFYTEKNGFENHLHKMKPTSFNYAYNFWRACSNIDADYLILLEDDLQFTSNWFNKAVNLHKKMLNCVFSLYSPHKIPSGVSEWDIDNPTNFYGCQATIWPKKHAEKFADFNWAINLNFYQLEQKNIAYQMDHLMAIYCKANRLPIYTCNPSLVQHVGFKTSGLAAFMHQSPTFKTQ